MSPITPCFGKENNSPTYGKYVLLSLNHLSGRENQASYLVWAFRDGYSSSETTARQPSFESTSADLSLVFII